MLCNFRQCDLSVCLSPDKLNHTDGNFNALQLHHINFRQCDLTRPYVCLLSNYITLTEIQMHYKVLEGSWRFLKAPEGF